MKYITIMLMLLNYMYAAGSHSGGHGDGHGGGHEEMSHWDAPESEAKRKNPIHSSNVSINKGKNLFAVNCASCHGVKADGTGIVGKNFKIKPTNLIEMSNKHKDGDFFWKIKTGKGNMPSFKNTFAKNEIWDLVNFIQSLSKKSGHHH